MKRLIVDLDHTICVPWSDEDQALDPEAKYRDAKPAVQMISKLREYRDRGFTIVISTSRNMRTYDGDVGLIREKSLPQILDWLDRHDVPFDDVIVGKPWCGFDGFYIDDRSVRPAEFVGKSYDEIIALMEGDRCRP